MDLHIDDDATLVTFTPAPMTPGRPPSPVMSDPGNDEPIAKLPVPPPPRESTSCPAELLPVPPPPRGSTSCPAERVAFKRTKFRPTSSSMEGSVRDKREELPRLDATPRQYPGKENAHLLLGTYGGKFYDVKCSRTGSPLRAKGTPRFGSGERFDRSKCYEGKESSQMLLGGYGPGFYDAKCSRTGSPLRAKGTPRFGSGERFDRSKCYEGKENAHLLRGGYGPGLYDVKCSRTGSPLGGSPRAGVSFGASRRFEKPRYEGKENKQMLLGAFGPGLYDIQCSSRGSPLWKNRPRNAFALPKLQTRAQVAQRAAC